MRKVIIVGIPILHSTISDKFLSIIEEIKTNKSCIAICTAPSETDYIQSPAGSKLLNEIPRVSFNENLYPLHINDITGIWNLKGKYSKRNASKTSNAFLEFIQEQLDTKDFNKYYIFVPGSPSCSSVITNALAVLEPEIVETPASIDIFKHCLSDKVVGAFEHVNYADRFVYEDNILQPKKNYKRIDNTLVNIFTCLQSMYDFNDKIIMQEFVNDMSSFYGDQDIVFAINIKIDGITIVDMDFIKFKQQWKDFCYSKDMFTIAVCKREMLK